MSLGWLADRNRMADDPKWLIKFDAELDEGNEDDVVDGSTPRKPPAIDVIV